MMNNEEMLCIYEVVAEITHDMRESAICHDWTRLSELEQTCKTYADKASEYKSLTPLSRQATERKMASLRRIMENDKQIRNVVEPWQRRLADMMSGKLQPNLSSSPNLLMDCNR